MTKHRRQGAGYRLAIAARTIVALLGGYALAALAVAVLALLSSAPREEAIAAATLPSFLIHLVAAVWAFAARTVALAWLGIGVPALGLVLFFWWLRAAAPAP